MTFREWAIDYLTQRGLWPAEAQEVSQVATGRDDGMRGRWDDTIDGYPAQMLAVIALGLNHEALKWIDAYAPKHFARPMFTPDFAPAGTKEAR